MEMSEKEEDDVTDPRQATGPEEGLPSIPKQDSEAWMETEPSAFDPANLCECIVDGSTNPPSQADTLTRPDDTDRRKDPSPTEDVDMETKDNASKTVDDLNTVVIKEEWEEPSSEIKEETSVSQESSGNVKYIKEDDISDSDQIKDENSQPDSQDSQSGCEKLYKAKVSLRRLEDQFPICKDFDESSPMKVEDEEGSCVIKLCRLEDQNIGKLLKEIIEKVVKIENRKPRKKRISGISYPKNFTCKACNKKYKSEKRYNAHITPRCPVKERYECEVCGKSFKQSHNLVKHAKVHVHGFTGSAQGCPVCGMILASAGSLRTHMTTHSDKKPFECDTCGKTFKTKRQRLRHIKLHSEVRPFVCQLCSKGFKSWKNLKVHLFIHGISSFECGLCDQVFRGGRELEAHLMSHEENNVMPEVEFDETSRVTVEETSQVKVEETFQVEDEEMPHIQVNSI